MAYVKGRAGQVIMDLEGTSGLTYVVANSALTVSTVAGTIKVPSHQLYQGQAITIAGAGLPAGLTAGPYFAVLVVGDTTLIKLATSLANAQNNVTVTLTSVGTANTTITTTDVSTVQTLIKSWDLDLSYQDTEVTVLGSTIVRKVKTLMAGSGSFEVLLDSVSNPILRAALAPNNDGICDLTLFSDAGNIGYSFKATLMGAKMSAKTNEASVYTVAFSVFSDPTYIGG